MHRADMLHKAAALTTGDRNESYGHPFDNMQAAADMVNAYLYNKYSGSALDPNQFKLTPEDMAHFMTIMKMVRTFNGKFHADNYVDGACYEAIAGECRFIQESDSSSYPKKALIPEAIKYDDPSSPFYGSLRIKGEGRPE